MTTTGHNSGGMPGDPDRDPRLDRVYREAAQEEPPARVDAAILAAARREVGARPRAVSARLRAWRVPVSIAAVVVLSVSMVTLVREEGGGRLDQPSTLGLESRDLSTGPAKMGAEADAAKAPERAQPAVRDDSEPRRPEAAAKAAEDTARRAAASNLAKDAPRRADTAPADRSPAPESRAMAPAAPAPQPFQGAPAARERQPVFAADQPSGASVAPQSGGFRGSEADLSAKPAEPAAGPRLAERMAQRDRGATGEVTGSLGTASTAPAATPAAKPQARMDTRAMKAERPQTEATKLALLIKEYETQPPEKWLEKIEALRREGWKAEADDLLAEFKRRFPDHPLPSALR